MDNTQNIYVPFHLKCGINAHCSLDVFNQCPEILEIVEEDMFAILRVLPPSLHKLIKKTNIWINVTYVYGSFDNPKVMKHTVTHHFQEWLMCVNDIPEKVLGIEIYNCFEYIRNRDHWNGCGLLLHEFCHLIHQLVLRDGLDNQYVQDLYETAMKSEKYEQVLRRDWAYLDCDTDTAYGTINYKEFFAEVSVAYLSCGYENLNNVNASMSMNALSPPIISPEVLKRRSQSTSNTNESKAIEEDKQSCLKLVFQINEFFGWSPHKKCCNKFFPFTRIQLKLYDPDTFYNIERLWGEIMQWEEGPAVSSSNTDCWKISKILCSKQNSPESEDELEEKQNLLNF
mmetsp:Transcript_15849/g.18416  ORF Transcript_15849/g.18416 Transcript_15849/m.18416 type:complete len:341 (+) Transcript_15849:91-1113(+)